MQCLSWTRYSKKFSINKWIQIINQANIALPWEGVSQKDNFIPLAKLFRVSRAQWVRTWLSAPLVLWLPFVDLLHSNTAAFCDVFHCLIVGWYDSYALGNGFGCDRMITCNHNNLGYRTQKLMGNGFAWLSRGYRSIFIKILPTLKVPRESCGFAHGQFWISDTTVSEEGTGPVWTPFCPGFFHIPLDARRSLPLCYNFLCKRVYRCLLETVSCCFNSLS